MKQKIVTTFLISLLFVNLANAKHLWLSCTDGRISVIEFPDAGQGNATITETSVPCAGSWAHQVYRVTPTNSKGEEVVKNTNFLNEQFRNYTFRDAKKNSSKEYNRKWLTSQLKTKNNELKINLSLLTPEVRKFLEPLI